jgi:hypothetical protein
MLEESATVLLFLQVITEKEIMEITSIIEDKEEGGYLAEAVQNKVIKRAIEGNPWHKAWRPEGHFNPEVLKKDWSQTRWEDRGELQNIEDDCRSLSLIIRLYVDAAEKGKQPDAADPIALHLVGMSLYRTASYAIGCWIPQIRLRLKKTKGYMPDKLKTLKDIDDIAFLLSFHKDRANAPFWKEARKLTGLSDSRIRENIPKAREVRKQQDKFLQEIFNIIKR